MARLGDYIEQIRGVSYKPEDVCTSTDGKAVAILRANNIQDDGLNFDDLVYVKGNKVSDKQYIRKGDIVICASSGSKNLVGKAAIANYDLPISFGAFCKVVRSRELNPSYVGHFFQSPKDRSTIAELSGGANINNIRNEHIDDLDIVVIDEKEQERVVAELDKLCTLISLRKQQLAKLDELVKSRFIELFGDPKYNKSNLVKIGEIGALTSGGTPSRAKPEYFEGDIRWYSAGELNSLYLPDSVEHISEMALQQSSAKLFNKGTLMIGMYDTAAFKMGILTEDSSSNQACANLNPKQGYNIVWLYYLFDIMKPIFLQERQGVRQKNLSLSKIKEFEVPFAPIELQEQFATFVEQTDKSKFEIQKSLEKLETLKKALMQKYFG